LILERAAGHTRDGIRLYSAVIDGHTVGKIGEGERLAVDVPAGIHVVQVRIDGFRSQALRIKAEADREVTLTCRPNDPSRFFVDDFVLGLIGRRPWIRLEMLEVTPQ
jgi:hypothetical protein